MVTTERFQTWLAAQRRLTPQHTLRASTLGFPCERRLWYDRTAWDQAALPSPDLQGIFLAGRDFEAALIRRLQEAGYYWRHHQRAVEWKALHLSGHIEGQISEDGEHWVLAEIKGIHPYYYDRIHHWRDFLGLGPIYGQYAAQIQVYMLLENVEAAILICGSKGSYRVRFLPVELDYAYAESLLQKAERVTQAVMAGDGGPPRITDRSVCKICPYMVACLPDQDAGAGATFRNDEDFLARLTQREALEPAAKAYQELDAAIKAELRGQPLVVAGPFIIEGREEIRRLKATEARESRAWVTRIRRLLGQAPEPTRPPGSEGPSLAPGLAASLKTLETET
jgi:CRISPR/Cas system-associated exonuclease Cas4 (RecB family)